MHPPRRCPRLGTLSLLAALALLCLGTAAWAQSGQDITHLFGVTKSAPVLDRVNGVTYSYVKLTNTSGALLQGRMRLVVASSTLPVAAKPTPPDGTTADGKPFYWLGTGEQTYAAGASSGNRRVNFQLQRVALSYGVRVEVMAEAAALVPASGGVLEVTAADSPLRGVQLAMPGAAVVAPTFFSIQEVSHPPRFSDGSTGLSPVVDLGPSGATFAEPVLVSLPYDGSSLEGRGIVDEQSLSVYTYDEVNGFWVPLPTRAIDTAARTITAEATHFSTFAVNGDKLHETNLGPATSSAPPVLFVHGIQLGFFGENDGFSTLEGTFAMAASLLEQQAGINTFWLQYDSHRKIEESAASLALAVRKIKAVTGAPRVNVIAHSQGGLVARAYLADMGNAPWVTDSALKEQFKYKGDIAKLATLGTPHGGADVTLLGDAICTVADYLQGIGALLGQGLCGAVSLWEPDSYKQMKPDSAFLAQLNAVGTGGAHARKLVVESVYGVGVTTAGPMGIAVGGDGIVPAERATLPSGAPRAGVKGHREYVLGEHYHSLAPANTLPWTPGLAYVDSDDHLGYKLMRMFAVDADSDGVTDLSGRDRCPDTPIDAAVDSNGCSLAQSVLQSTPLLLAPANGAAAEDPEDVILQWKPLLLSNLAELQYCVVVNEDREPDDIPVWNMCDQGQFVGETSIRLASILEPGRRYWWAVWAREPGGMAWSKASDWWSFTTLPDADGDGFAVGADCDDASPQVFPGAPEVCGNGIDEDCSGRQVKVQRAQDGSKFVLRTDVNSSSDASVNLRVRLLSGAGCWYTATPRFDQDHLGMPVSNSEVRIVPPYGNIVIDDDMALAAGQYYYLYLNRNDATANLLTALDVIFRGIFSVRLEEVVVPSGAQMDMLLQLAEEVGFLDSFDAGTVELLTGDYVGAFQKYVEGLKAVADAVGHERMEQVFTSVLGRSGSMIWNHGITTFLQALSLPEKYFLLREIADNYLINPGPWEGFASVRAVEKGSNGDCVVENPALVAAVVQNFASTDYSLLVSVEGANISTVEVLGPGIIDASGPMGAMLYTLDGRPVLGTTYTIRITYTGGIVDERTFTVSTVNDNFAYLTSPADGETISTTTPTVLWTEAPGAASYRIVVKSVAGGTETLIWEGEYPAGVFSAAFDEDGTATAPLADGGEYRVYLHSFDAAGSLATTTSTFRVGSALPAPPTGVTANYENGAVMVRWDNMGAGITYKVYWGTSSGVTTGSEYGGATPNTEFRHTGVVPEWTYYYRVLSVNSADTMSALSLEAHATVTAAVEGEVLWSFQTGGEVFSSPAVAPDGTVYVNSDDHYVYALNPDGSLKWRYLTGANFLFLSPTVGQDGRVYVSAKDGYFYALNPDGTLRWRYPTGDNLHSSPALGSDGAVYVGSANGLYALAPDGSLKWRFGLGEVFYVSPVVGLDGTIYVGTQNNYFYAIKPDGSMKWRYANGSGFYAPASLGADGTIYVGSRDDYFYALDPADGTVKWRHHAAYDFYAAASVAGDGTIYVGNADGYVYALAANGSLKWSYRTADNTNGTPALGADGTIYVPSNDYSLYALNPDGTLRWRYRTNGNVTSSPAIAPDGTLYVGSAASAGRIYAIKTNSSGLAQSPWPMFQRDLNHSGAAASVYQDPVTGMEFVYVAPGTFLMGDTLGDCGLHENFCYRERPVHTVTLQNGFYLGKTEVTQAQWQAVMGSNPSYFQACGPTCPVEQVSWNDAQAFIANLNTLTGKTFRLPTEAEWEFAAKGGVHAPNPFHRYAGSDNADEVGWHEYNRGQTTHPVGQKLPNELGLYGLSGNVWEWVQDWFAYYPAGPAVDPRGPASPDPYWGSYRVMRSGSWFYDPWYLRSSLRAIYPPNLGHSSVGFRLVLEPDPPPTYLDPVTGMEFVYVAPGTFQMGDTFGLGAGYEPERPAHMVALTKGFYLGKYEVTQDEWQAVMGSNPSYFQPANGYPSCPDCPVEQISWNDAQGFVAALNARTGRTYRMPTESEWEYAARGGPHQQPYRWAGSDNPDEVAWHAGNSGGRTHTVGGKNPNTLGVYDLSGNVWEWCSDWYYWYPVGPVTDPQGPPTGLYRADRGGAWYYPSTRAGVSSRDTFYQHDRNAVLGVRLVLEPSASDADGDGYADSADAFPIDSAEWLDTDGDGVGNNADLDDDNDGMTDVWEQQYGLNPLVNDAGGDLDGDGNTNLAEFEAGSDPTAAVNLPLGLVAHWTFDAGDARDDSGSGNSGVPTDTAPVQDRFGAMGRACGFNGSSSYITVPDSPSLRLSTGLTVSAWIWVSSYSTIPSIAMKRSGEAGFAVGVDFVGYLSFGTGATRFSGVAPQTSKIEVGRWRHVVGSYDGAYQTIYLDGVLLNSRYYPNQLAPNSAPMVIGANLSDSSQRLNGAIDDIRLYNRALSSAEVQALYEAEKPAGPPPTFTDPLTGMEFVYVAPGTFEMGDVGLCQLANAWWCPSERPIHTVILTKGFYLSKTEVTQAQWQAVMNSNPSYFQPPNRSPACPTCPVESVSWEETQDFIAQLGALTGKAYRLPTEAEWEYAARGGAYSQGYKYAGSNDPDLVAWTVENGTSSYGTKPVGGKLPNELGLYDMSGNVWEWVQDWFGGYSSGSQVDPVGPSSGSVRVFRGGTWDDHVLWGAYVSGRYNSAPDNRINNLGFRLALDPNAFLDP